jgi:formamidopyrimidine-DNA glycosylase
MFCFLGFINHMPELPEVETTRRGIEPYLLGQTIREVIIRRGDLRLPVPVTIDSIETLDILRVERRAKYLIIHLTKNQYLLIHLGMSGSLRITNPADEFRKHDHIAITLASGKQLRFHDPRRFGIFTHLLNKNPYDHVLLKKLGPEPFCHSFHSEYLFHALRKKSISIKVAIMDNLIVVGVGNIYASESLFDARISPELPANQVSQKSLIRLVESIQKILQRSIDQGGTTLRDFLHQDGSPGYFRQQLFVYGRAGESCRICKKEIVQMTQGQRSTFYCPSCQKK